MKLLHLSDLHFQADCSLIGLGARDWRQLFARLEFIWQGRPPLFRKAGATVAELLAEGLAAGAEHLLVTGDLTAIGLREELVRARASLAPFEGRLTVIPGNHDRTSKASAPIFESIFGDLLRSELPELCAEGPYPFVHLVGEDAAIVGLDSGRVPLIPGVSRGRVGTRQLAALRRILSQPRLEGRAVVVAVHHAPRRPDGRPDRALHGLADAGELLALADAHRVAAICHGHIHHRYRIGRGELPPLLCAGSSTQLGREGYWLLDVPQTGPLSATSRQPSAADR